MEKHWEIKCTVFLLNTPCIPIDLGNSQGLEGQGIYIYIYISCLINDFYLQSYYKVDVAKQLGGGFAKIHPMAGHQHLNFTLLCLRHISTFKTFLIFLVKNWSQVYRVLINMCLVRPFGCLHVYHEENSNISTPKKGTSYWDAMGTKN